MFGMPSTLIVVYKDELVLNQLKKLVESNDDGDGVVGTKDGSVRLVAWTEKVWNEQKKAGNVENKVLFLGDVAGSEKLLPIINVKYNEYGIVIGWAGKQALLHVDPKKLSNKDSYNTFLEKLNVYPVPNELKNEPNQEQETQADSQPDQEQVGAKKGGFAFALGKTIKGAGKAFGAVANFAKKTVSEIGSTIDDLPADKGLMIKQQSFYGVIKLYENFLEEFVSQ